MHFRKSIESLLIDQRRDFLPRDLKDELELESDESIFEDTI